jgi:hypothetical protein
MTDHWSAGEEIARRGPISFLRRPYICRAVETVPAVSTYPGRGLNRLCAVRAALSRTTRSEPDIEQKYYEYPGHRHIKRSGDAADDVREGDQACQREAGNEEDANRSVQWSAMIV